MKQCSGCGITLQTEVVGASGYVKSLEHDLCQSCFRLRHYRDYKHVRADVNLTQTLEFIETFKGHIFWIVDVMHLTQSLHDGLIRALSKKDVVMVVNKRDLLPKSVSNGKLKHAIMQLLAEYRITLMDMVFVSSKIERSLKPLYPYLEDAPVAFVGCINAGKSSLLNALLKTDSLSVSPVSNTTANIIQLLVDDYELYDTPGFIRESELPKKFTDECLVHLSPSKTIKPMVFQIYERQALILGNLGYIEIEPVDTVNIVSYLPFSVKRVKPDRAEANLDLEHDFMILNPAYRTRHWPRKDFNVDLEIFDVGFISIQGKYNRLKTVMDVDAEIVLRKAII